jgi:anti-sigma factor RsiW
MSTRCGRFAEPLHRKVDGRLPETEAAVLEEHLAACASCAERAARLQWIADRLRRGMRVVASGFTDRVLRRVAAP